MLITVTLPRDRTQLGTLIVKDKFNNSVLSTYCLGLSDEAFAASFNNVDKNPLKLGGNTPYGSYKCVIELFKNPTEQDIHSYGPNGLIHLNALSGDAIIACSPLNKNTGLGGRSGICLHGGVLNGAYTQWKFLRPTHGCIRILDTALLTIFETATTDNDEDIICNVIPV
jgi:hypothetical protein